jgi:hypothetical protein
MSRNLITWIRDRAEARRLAHLIGCTQCGRKAIRYLYVDTFRGKRVVSDVCRCEACGPFEDEVPWADYGTDREVTFNAAEGHVITKSR